MTDEGPSRPAYALLTLDEVHAALDRLKKTIICAPDVYECVRTAVYDAGLDRYYRIVEHLWLDDGQVLLGPSEAELMDIPLSTFPFDGQGKAPAGEAGAWGG